MDGFRRKGHVLNGTVDIYSDVIHEHALCLTVHTVLTR